MESREVEAGTKELERVDLLHRREINLVSCMIQITPPSQTPFVFKNRRVSLHRVTPHQMNNSQSEAHEVLTIVEEAALAFPPAVAEERELCCYSSVHQDMKTESLYRISFGTTTLREERKQSMAPIVSRWLTVGNTQRRAIRLSYSPANVAFLLRLDQPSPTL